MVIAFALVLVMPSFGISRGIWLGLVAAVPAHVAALRLLEGPSETARVIPAQKMALLAFLLYAALAGLGAALVR
jgi:hypothetical protein